MMFGKRHKEPEKSKTTVRNEIIDEKLAAINEGLVTLEQRKDKLYDEGIELTDHLDQMIEAYRLYHDQYNSFQDYRQLDEIKRIKRTVDNTGLLLGKIDSALEMLKTAQEDLISAKASGVIVGIAEDVDLDAIAVLVAEAEATESVIHAYISPRQQSDSTIMDGLDALKNEILSENGKNEAGRMAVAKSKGMNHVRKGFDEGTLHMGDTGLDLPDRN